MRRAIISLGLLVALALHLGCKTASTPANATSTSNANKSASEQIQPVPTEDTEFVASGPITVENQLDVAVQRDGIISELLVDAGDSVRKGQLLARLDDRQLKADRDAARAQSASIEADLKNWEATVKMAETDLNRSEKMWENKLITESQVDHDRFKLVATKYELDREQKNLQRANSVAESLELEVEKTRIVAPFDGVVARRYVRLGQRVANGDRLFWVTAVSPMRVKFTLPEKYAAQVRRGTMLEVVPSEMAEQKYAAKVVLLSPVIDPASGTIDVTAELVGPTGSLRPGMVSNIRLETSR
ncbi:MAG TPA: efflux RND transporter periplasmic adaptor subunit [Terriglobales bacterium]|nr:efflux RND transporter periplasmic adaptor subunit [Terriglobales bacterium]